MIINLQEVFSKYLFKENVIGVYGIIYKQKLHTKKNAFPIFINNWIHNCIGFLNLLFYFFWC